MASLSDEEAQKVRDHLSGAEKSGPTAFRDVVPAERKHVAIKIGRSSSRNAAIEAPEKTVTTTTRSVQVRNFLNAATVDAYRSMASLRLIEVAGIFELLMRSFNPDSTGLLDLINDAKARNFLDEGFIENLHIARKHRNGLVHRDQQRLPDEDETIWAIEVFTTANWSILELADFIPGYLEPLADSNPELLNVILHELPHLDTSR